MREDEIQSPSSLVAPPFGDVPIVARLFKPHVEHDDHYGDQEVSEPLERETTGLLRGGADHEADEKSHDHVDVWHCILHFIPPEFVT